MIQLFPTKDLLVRMGLPAIPEASPALKSAIMSAHLRIEATLETKFDKGTSDDVFYLDRMKTGGVVPDGFFRLKLKHGFIRDDDNFVVTIGDSPQTLSTVLDHVEYEHDCCRGYAYIPEKYEFKYVKVSYGYGFRVLPDGVTIHPAPPEALADAIAAYTPAVLEFSTNNSTVGTKVADQNKRNSAWDHAFSVISPYLRRKGCALSPVY